MPVNLPFSCGENYKANDPSFAAFDCEQARAMTDTPQPTPKHGANRSLPDQLTGWKMRCSGAI